MKNIVEGITLNQQLVDLLSIIDENESLEEQNERINEYIQNLANLSKGYEKGGPKFALEHIINSLENGDKLKRLLVNFYGKKNNEKLDICDSEMNVSELYELLKNEGISIEECQEINTLILKGLRETDFQAKPGILAMTPDDVRNLHTHMFDENGKCRYDRITMDTSGRYSDFVSIDGKTFCDGHIERMIGFARRHDMDTKINTFMMYSDFPTIFNEHLSKKVERGLITEAERKEILKNSLLKYVIEIGTTYGDKITSADIFNELIYNPGSAEKKESFAEYEFDENGNKIIEGYDEEQKPIYREVGYIERCQTGWQKYLSLDDLCEMAVIARTVLPDATFTYNDWNWVIPEKRAAMIDIVNRIQTKHKEIQENGGIYVNDEIRKMLMEKGITVGKDGKLEFGEEQTIIDNIGFESHLSTETTPEEYEEAVDEVAEKTGLPIEVTELDVAYEKNPAGDEELRKEMKQKQLRLFAKIDELLKKGKIMGSTIWSLGKYSFTDKMYGYITHASKLDDNFKSKTEERETGITFQQEGKNGLDDCMQDDKVKVSTEQDATKTVKNAVLNKDKVLDVNEHNIQE